MAIVRRIQHEEQIVKREEIIKHERPVDPNLLSDEDKLHEIEKGSFISISIQKKLR